MLGFYTDSFVRREIGPGYREEVWALLQVIGQTEAAGR